MDSKCSGNRYYHISFIALINWYSPVPNPSCATAVYILTDVFLKLKFLFFFFQPWAYVTQSNERRTHLRQVSWLSVYHSFLLLTRRPARHAIAFHFGVPEEALCSEINWRKIWRRYFTLLLFSWMLRCSPWLLIHRCSEINTSRYYLAVFACGLLIPFRLLCVSRYVTLNGTIPCTCAVWWKMSSGTLDQGTGARQAPGLKKTVKPTKSEGTTQA